MPSRNHQFIRPLVAVTMVAASTIYAIAQQPPTPTRVRGTIEGVAGDVLAVKSRGGEDVKLHMTSDIRVVGITKIALSDIKVGSFIGTTRTQSRCTFSRKTCAAPARARGPTIYVPTAA
jgi:hypothetical protein